MFFFLKSNISLIYKSSCQYLKLWSYLKVEHSWQTMTSDQNVPKFFKSFRKFFFFNLHHAWRKIYPIFHIAWLCPPKSSPVSDGKASPNNECSVWRQTVQCPPVVWQFKREPSVQNSLTCIPPRSQLSAPGWQRHTQQLEKKKTVSTTVWGMFISGKHTALEAYGVVSLLWVHERWTSGKVVWS